VGSIMKCNTLESERDFVILRMYAQKIPTSWTEGTGGDSVPLERFMRS